MAGVVLLGSYLYLRNALSGQAEALAIKMADIHPATELTIARETVVKPPPDPTACDFHPAAAHPRAVGEGNSRRQGGRRPVGDDDLHSHRQRGAVSLGRGKGQRLLRSNRRENRLRARSRAGRDSSVDGYTDSDPIRTVAFPSNFELSEARAKSVAAMLKPGISHPERLTVSGKGADNPVAPNDTEAEQIEEPPRGSVHSARRLTRI